MQILLILDVMTIVTGNASCSNDLQVDEGNSCFMRNGQSAMVVESRLHPNGETGSTQLWPKWLVIWGSEVAKLSAHMDHCEADTPEILTSAADRHTLQRWIA